MGSNLAALVVFWMARDATTQLFLAFFISKTQTYYASVPQVFNALLLPTICSVSMVPQLYRFRHTSRGTVDNDCCSGLWSGCTG